MPKPNDLLRAARKRIPSPSNPPRPMSRAELADAVCAWLWHTSAEHAALDGGYIAKLERGAVQRPRDSYRAALRAVLGVSTDREIGMGLYEGSASDDQGCRPPDLRLIGAQ